MTGLVTTISGCETESHTHIHIHQIRNLIYTHVYIHLHVQVERSPKRAVLRTAGCRGREYIFRDVLTRDKTRRNAGEKRADGREREGESEREQERDRGKQD